MSDTKELEVKASSLETEAGALVVVTEEQYLAANAFGAQLTALKREIHASCDPVCEAADKAHKVATAQRAALLAPVDHALIVVNAKQVAWKRAEDARLAEIRRKAEEEARRKAEEEALRVAESLQAEGMTEAANEALEAPVVERVVVPTIAKAEGTSYRETWSAEVLDLKALVAAVASGAAPLVYIEANMTALNQAARMLKNSAVIPGVKIKAETTIARR